MLLAIHLQPQDKKGEPILRHYRVLAGAILIFAICGHSAIAQTDLNKKTIEQAERAKKEKALRTDEENKLISSLYDLMTTAEAADSSQEQRQHLADVLKMDKDLRADSKGRVHVVIYVRSADDRPGVKAVIRALGGESERVGNQPVVSCWIHPKRLRDLIKVNSISRISIAFPPIMRTRSN